MVRLNPDVLFQLDPPLDEDRGQVARQLEQHGVQGAMEGAPPPLPEMHPPAIAVHPEREERRLSDRQHHPAPEPAGAVDAAIQREVLARSVETGRHHPGKLVMERPLATRQAAPRRTRLTLATGVPAPGLSASAPRYTVP